MRVLHCFTVVPSLAKLSSLTGVYTMVHAVTTAALVFMMA